MKTTKQVLTRTMTGLMALIALAGCGKNSDGGPSAAGVGVYSTCAGCAANTQPMMLATSQNAQLGEGLQLQFYGPAGATYQTALAGGVSQVAAQGILVIGQYATMCGLPPGQYQVSTYNTPATMSGSAVQGMNLIGTGPAQVFMQFSSLFFISPTRFQATGVMYGPTGQQQPCSFSYY